jgi:hypothetical protein
MLGKFVIEPMVEILRCAQDDSIELRESKKT